jgi:Xaa-Pro aminopeptidase
MALPASADLAARHARVRRQLDTLSLDALVVSSTHNIRYLSNHVGSSGLLVLSRDRVRLLADFRYREAVARLQESHSACPGLVLVDVPASYEEALIQTLGEMGAESVGFEAADVSVARHSSWQRIAARLERRLAFRPTERAVEQSRVVKDAWETATLREAAARLTPVAEAAFAAAKAGVTERQVAMAIEAALRGAGFERPSFETIVATGPNGALPHHRAGDRILAAGDLVVLDFGGVLDGYCSDLTRTVSIGPPSPEAERLYTAVLDAQQAAMAAVGPGVESTAVDLAARHLLESRGLGDAFGHGTGHGLGLEVHEEPRVTRPRPDVQAAPLEPGMVITIEPGAYLPGFGGVRIEDDVLVTGSGSEVLTRVSRELRSL